MLMTTQNLILEGLFSLAVIYQLCVIAYYTKK
jgi:hypothetical protein